MLMLFLLAQKWKSTSSYWISAFLVILLGSSSSLYQNATFGLGALIGPQYTGAIMFGNAFSGIFCCLLRICCLLIFGQTQSGQEYIYIYIGLSLGTWVFTAIYAIIIVIAIYTIFPLLTTEIVADQIIKTTRRFSIIDTARIISDEDTLIIDEDCDLKA